MKPSSSATWTKKRRNWSKPRMNALCKPSTLVGIRASCFGFTECRWSVGSFLTASDSNLPQTLSLFDSETWHSLQRVREHHPEARSGERFLCGAELLRPRHPQTFPHGSQCAALCQWVAPAVVLQKSECSPVLFCDTVISPFVSQKTKQSEWWSPAMCSPLSPWSVKVSVTAGMMSTTIEIKV